MRDLRILARIGFPVLAVGLAVSMVGTVTAHTSAGTGITVTPTGGRSISATGTWHWGGMSGATTLSYVGYAIDWGDVATGNDVGTYHIGDGTAATNLVLQPTTPAQGSDGSWGPVAHTYAKAGTYTVCAIMYDLGPTKPFATTGYHSTQAGGTNHNIDNSVDKGSSVPAECATFAVTDPSASPTTAPTAAPTATPVPTSGPEATPTPVATPTPFQSFLGATAEPINTPPPTSTAGSQTQPGGTPLLLLPLLLLAISGSFIAWRTSKVRQ
jgi:hypothetical protein